MLSRRWSLSLLVPLVAACGGGLPGPLALAYGDHGVDRLTYAHADSTTVSVSMMGQSMSIEQTGSAIYDVALSEAPAGVGVTLSVRELDASIVQPLGAPVRVDEGAVDGDVVFTLDRMGNPTITSLPTVDVEAVQLVSGLSIAHSFFPAMPGRAMDAGAGWVDTVSFEGEEGGGSRSERSITTYTVDGPAMADGRPVVRIVFAGTSTVANDFELGGMAISQESEIDVEGHVLWDQARGVMVEHVRRGRGSGSVRVPMVPQALPIEIDTVQRSRLGGM